jgi:hypothetical protein
MDLLRVAEPVNERARLRDPLARNDGEGYTVIARSAATKQSILSVVAWIASLRSQ